MILAERLQLVTKPFGSASALSKPFRPPSFIRPRVGPAQLPARILAAAEKPQHTTAARELIKLELPKLSEEGMEEAGHRECTSMLDSLFPTF